MGYKHAYRGWRADMVSLGRQWRVDRAQGELTLELVPGRYCEIKSWRRRRQGFPDAARGCELFCEL
jgi:hypothetical protein